MNIQMQQSSFTYQNNRKIYPSFGCNLFVKRSASTRLLDVFTRKTTPGKRLSDTAARKLLTDLKIKVKKQTEALGLTDENLLCYLEARKDRNFGIVIRAKKEPERILVDSNQSGYKPILKPEELRAPDAAEKITEIIIRNLTHSSQKEGYRFDQLTGIEAVPESGPRINNIAKTDTPRPISAKIKAAMAEIVYPESWD